MGNKPLLSICIPTYNRQEYLKQCLDSIVNQKGFDTEKIEIVISDNASPDKTNLLVKEYQKKYKNITYSRNDQNIWAILNLINIPDKANWEYLRIIWDDDKIFDWWLKIIYNILLKQRDIWWLFVDYSSYDEKTCTTTYISWMDKMNQWCKNKIWKGRIIAIDWADLYRYIDHAPTFLPSLIMKKSFFQKDDLNLFLNNCYPHTGICTLNTKNQKIVLVNILLIRWFIPEKNWWQRDWNYLFDATLDHLIMNFIIKNDARCPFNEKKYQEYKNIFLIWYIKLIVLSKAFWFKPQKKHIQNLSMIFWRGILFYFYLVPLLYLPFWKLFKIIIPSRYF